MKIVSKTRDYYDYLANVYGVDETLRYNRGDFVECLSFDKFEIRGDTLESYKTWKQKRYPFYNQENPSDMLFRYASGDYRKQDLGMLLYVAGRSFVFKKKKVIENSDCWTFGTDKTTEHQIVSEIQTPEWADRLSVDSGKPVYAAEGDAQVMVNGKHVVYISMTVIPPCLKSLGLQKHMDANTVYKLVQCWLENNRKEFSIPDAENDVKIQAAGFDHKISFRHRK